jgi:PAS domain S-box-containing protein
VDAERKTLYANKAFFNIFGYQSIAEVGTNPLIEHHTPEEKARYLIREAKRARGEFVAEMPEVDIIRQDGSIRHL